MNVLSLSMTYPTADWPARGTFIRRRLEAMAQRADLRVIAPQPWFPLAPRSPGGAPSDDALPTHRPRTLYIPRFFKTADPWLYARRVVSFIHQMRHEFEPDIIDAHYVWPDGVAAAMAAATLDIPFSVTIRGKIVSHRHYPDRCLQIRDMLRTASVRIAVCDYLAQVAREVAETPLDVHVIPNGVDTSIFHPTDRDSARRSLRHDKRPLVTLSLDPDVRYLVSVGYVQELKGFDRLVSALPAIRARCGDVRLLLVGEEVGEHGYEARLDQLISESGMSSFVHRIGRVEPPDVSRLIAASDLFVLSTRAEGWCNAIHEALACGRPVVTTHVGGNAELVHNNVNGFLVPFDREALLVDAVSTALSQRWDHAAIAQQAGSRTWNRVGDEVIDLFEEVTSASCTRPLSGV